jgi:hypothetical protein
MGFAVLLRILQPVECPSGNESIGIKSMALMGWADFYFPLT